MLSVTLGINGGDPIELDNVADLAQAALQNGGTVLKALLSGDSFGADLTQPLSSLGSGKSLTLGISDGDPSWNLPGGVATFTLSASATANFSVLQAGDAIFSYDTDILGGGTVPVLVGPGQAYLHTSLNFAIDGNLSASSAVGAIGVSASVDASASYVVENFKAFPAATPILDAVKLAIAKFTFPLHPNTVTNLQDGDCLHYTFDGALDVGFGFTYGVSGQVSASSIAQLSGLFNPNQKFFQLSPPAVAYGASVGASAAFNWSRTFDCFLQRAIDPATSTDAATLHIAAAKSSSQSVTLQANAGITQTVPPVVSFTPDDVLGVILQKITGSSTISPTNWPLQALNGAADQAISQATAEVQQYIADVNNWLAGLFQDLQNHGSIGLAAVLSRTDQFTSAFTYNFDRSNANFAAAWNEAIQGDFMAVLRSGAATLDTGSGLEKLHTASTKLSLTWFGLTSSTVASHWSQTVIRYKGKGLFGLEVTSGSDYSTSSNSSSTTTSVYLQADADGAGDDQGAFGPVAQASVVLRARLACSQSAQQVSRLGALLHALNGGAQTDAASAALKYLSLRPKPGVVVVDITVGLQALARLQSDRYINKRQPPPPHSRDQANWAAFIAAQKALAQSGDPAMSLQYAFPQNEGWYEAYGTWASYDAALNGTPSEDRRGILNIPMLQNAIDNIPSDPGDATKFLLAVYWSAAQQFLNFCEDVQATVQLVSGESIDWPTLAGSIQKAGGDIDPWFGPATVLAASSLALRSAANAQALTVLGADGSAAVTVSIA